MTVPPPATPRNIVGWTILLSLFALIYVLSVLPRAKDLPESRIMTYRGKLKKALEQRKEAKGSTYRAQLTALEKQLESRRKSEAIEAAYWVAVRTELGESVAPTDLKPMRKEPQLKPVLEAYETKKWERKRAKVLVAELRKGGPLSTLAADHVTKVAKLPEPPEKAIDPMLAVWTAGLFVAVGGSYVLLLINWGSGFMRTLGPAIQVPTLYDADRLADRAAILFGSFLGLQVVAGLLRLPPVVEQFISYGSLLLIVPLVLRKPSLSEIGVSREGLGRNLLIGFWFCFIQLPVSLTLGALGSRVGEWLGAAPPEHPSALALEASPSLAVIAVTFFSAVVVAPFWEETFFRGLLFPALRRVVRSPGFASVLSSFLFASIHPQGIAGWPGLMSVGMFSCFLANHTRSLVPSMAMHFLHNGIALTTALLFARG